MIAARAATAWLATAGLAIGIRAASLGFNVVGPAILFGMVALLLTLPLVRAVIEESRRYPEDKDEP